MDLEHLLPGVVGAVVGVIGWLGVGLFIQRRQFGRQARTAARAVYFELEGDRVAIDVALQHGSFTPLGRAAFDRLLPELAMLLSVEELRVLSTAYLAQVGYRQMASDHEVPAAVRQRALEAMAGAHGEALAVLGRRAFSAREARALADGSAALRVAAIEAPTPMTGGRDD